MPSNERRTIGAVSKQLVDSPDAPPALEARALRSELEGMRGALHDAVLDLFEVVDGRRVLRVRVDSPAGVGAIVKAYKEIVALDIQLAAVEARTMESARVTELRQMIVTFIRQSGQSDRIALLRGMNRTDSVALPTPGADAEFSDVVGGLLNPENALDEEEGGSIDNTTA